MPETNDAGETGSLEVVPPSALEALERAEVDIAIATAKKYPRDIATCIKTCKQLALRTKAIAATCNYAVPRGGKKLVGPSVHFARLVAYSWGNSTALSRVIGCDRSDAHLQGVFHDLESNTRIGFEMDWPVQAPHTDTPERWKDQMNLAKRGGAAVALRTAIFNVIPLVLFQDIAEEAKHVVAGEGKTFAESRSNAIAACKTLGITQEQIYRALEVGGLESITTDDLIYLHGLLQSITEGRVTAIDVFGRPEETPARAQVPRPRRQQQQPETPPEDGEQKPKSEEPKRPEPEAKQTASAPLTETETPERETKPTKPETKEPPEETPDEPRKPERTKKPAPAPQPSDLVSEVRAKLAESGITEKQLVEWLDRLGTVSGPNLPLDQVHEKWLKMMLKEWDGTVAQVRDNLAEAVP